MAGAATRTEELVVAVARREAAGLRLPLVVRDGPGDGFERAADLHRPGPRLDACVAASAALGGTDRSAIGAQWWLERVAWLLAATGLAGVLACRAVPDLAPERVLIAERGGLPAALALPDGPLARTGGGDAALAAALGDELRRHLAPLVAALAATRRRPARALWRAAGDRTAQAALWAGEATGRPDDALALAVALLGSADPMGVPVRVAPGDDGRPVQMRSSCCLAHRAAAGVHCPGCPRRRTR
jgi:ferric iron reductase protein FhuF